MCGVCVLGLVFVLLALYLMSRFQVFVFSATLPVFAIIDAVVLQVLLGGVGSNLPVDVLVD